jgi:outer membrane protein TolC
MQRNELLYAALLAGMTLGSVGCRSTPAPGGNCGAGIRACQADRNVCPTPTLPSARLNGQICPVRYAERAPPAPAGEPVPAPPASAAGGPPPAAAGIPAPGPADVPGATIDFAGALSLASGQNPRVAFAQEAVSAAYAQSRAAGALWLPSIQAGVSYNKTEGPMQETGGGILDVSRGALNAGLGTGSIGAGLPRAPGVVANFHVADAIFQPHVAEARTAASHAAFNATLNDTLLETSLAYLSLLRALQQQAIAGQTLRNAQQLADMTREFARTGQGAQADADRAQTELVLRQNNVQRAEEAARVASAQLAELLSVDATLPLHPAEPTIVPVDLVAVETPARELVATALSTRPELGESRALVAAAVETLRREQYAPLVPSILLGISEGGFGGGRGGDIGTFHDRFDVDAMAVWQIRNLGLGDVAAREEAGARLRQARQRDVGVMNRVAREVVEAHAQVQARQGQIVRAEQGFKTATDSYHRNLKRIRNGQGLPLEVLQAMQALDQAQSEYLRATADYSEAQFRLYRALGWPNR